MVPFRPDLASQRLNGTAAPLFAILCGFLFPDPASAADADAILDSWIQAQKSCQTWSADFTQTRTLKSLNKPLVSTGKVWFSNPGRFRWETASPAPTIAVRDATQMLVIYPRLKRAERYPLGEGNSGAMGDALSLFDAGFPRDRKVFDARFRLVSVADRHGCWEIGLQPAKAMTRKIVPAMSVLVRTNDFSLKAFEITFGDGSVMRNEFSGQILNAPIGNDVFHPALSGEYKLTEPLHQ